MAQILNSSMLKYYLEPIISSCELWKDKNVAVFIISFIHSGLYSFLKVFKDEKGNYTSTKKDDF